MKIALITACGAKKLSYPAPAIKLYRSPRIKAVYNRSEGADFYILSAKYGLVPAHQVLEPYDEVMTFQKAVKLAPVIAETIKNYDTAIFYRGGARREYLDCVVQACRLAKVSLIVIGYGQIGDINKIPQIIKQLKKHYNFKSKFCIKLNR